jgi:hypothetical protein
LLGGKQIPASGFALYVDKLINRIPDLPLSPKILIPAKDKFREAFTLAQRLRQEGYIVEMGEGQPSILSPFIIQLEGERFHLTDPQGRGQILSSVPQLLQALEAGGAAKISPA